MMIKHLQFAAIILTAIAMAAGWAHLLAFPNKMTLSREEYLTVQQIYQGWAFLGIAVVGALVAGAALTVLQRHQGAAFHLSLTATLCIALSLALFFAFTFPANRVTLNWTELPPEGWEALRRRWEYSHVAGAILYFAALAALVLTAIFRRR